MNSDDRDESQDLSRPNDHPDNPSSPDARPEIVATTDPAIATGRGQELRPDESIVAETSQFTRPGPAASHPIEPRRAGSSGGEPEKKKKEAEERARAGGQGDHGGQAAPSNRPGWMRLVLTGVVALACGAGGAWAYSRIASSSDEGQSKGSDQSKSKAGGSPDPQDKGQDGGNDRGKGGGSSGVSGSPNVGDTSGGGGDGVKDQIRNLAARLDMLKQRVETMAMPRDANPPDLASLRIKVDEFSRAADEVKDLSARKRDVEGRLDRLQEEMKGLRDQLDAAKGRGELAAKAPIADPESLKVEKQEKRADPVPPQPPTSVPPVDPRSPEESMAAGMDLFKKGKYPQAEAIFQNLRSTKPQDARVWYYSALTNGFATGHWDGETRAFVIQGAERERAGLPSASEIDSALADLSPASGKDWLASYRSQLMKR